MDVDWLSDARIPRREAYAVVERGPEIGVEVMPPSNVRAEVAERRRLFFKRGPQEVGFCDAEGNLEFFAPAGRIPKSVLCPKFPARLVT